MNMDMRILVVDDLGALRMSVCSILKHLGFKNVVAAEDGFQALEMLASQSVDFLITDLDMPGMDGIELLRAVRADAHLKEVPVLFLTADGEKTRVMEAFRAGVSDYILKPFTIDLLDTKIRSVFGQGS